MEEFDREVWEHMKEKYDLSPCSECDDIKKDPLRMKEQRCIFCMYYWLG